jgi:2-C-methyl-D-erythritol 4-phosphate cytidylyltransferase
MQRGQTPQSFRKALLVQAHRHAENNGIFQATCDIQLALRLGAKVKRVDGDETNIKITTPIDLYLAEHILRKKTAPHIADFDFRGKKIALIGASGGIGRQIHKELLKEGAEVIPLSRNSTPFSLNLLKTSSIKKTSKDLFDHYGALDGCIFSAGCLHKGAIEKLEEKQVNEMARVNFLSLVPLLQHLRLKKEALFILIGSSSYFRGRKEIGVYSATKAASINLLQSLSEECPELKIQIICPKRTDTPMRKRNFPFEDPSTLADPWDVAKSILEKIKKNSCKGEILNLL